jgi:hypothetical protein
VAAIVTGDVAAAPASSGADEIVVEVLGVPLRSLAEFRRHYRELRREVRLLALAHESDYPLARDLSDLFGSLDRELRDRLPDHEVHRALDEGAETTDLRTTLPRSSAPAVGRLVDLLDLADEFCRAERLLSLARSPEQQAFQRWFLTEFVRQGRGEPPLAWQDAAVSEPQSSAS